MRFDNSTFPHGKNGTRQVAVAVHIDQEKLKKAGNVLFRMYYKEIMAELKRRREMKNDKLGDEE